MWVSMSVGFVAVFLSNFIHMRVRKRMNILELAESFHRIADVFAKIAKEREFKDLIFHEGKPIDEDLQPGAAFMIMLSWRNA